MGALVPPAYRWLVIGLLVAVACAVAWLKGAAHVQARWDLAEARTAQAGAERAWKRAEATVQIVTRYVDRIQYVRDTTQTTLAEVPRHVTQDDDARCAVTAGFVRLHDAAVQGRLPPSPGPSDAATAGIALSGVAASVVGNYGRCHENAEQLTALQEWVRRMAAP